MTETFSETRPFDLRNEARKEFAELLGQIPWSWFVTLTFEKPASKESADKKFRTWIRQLEALTGADIGWYRAEEGGNYSGCGMPGERRHFHALLICNRMMSIRKATLLWMNLSGYAFIKVYDPSRNGVWYCTKHACSEWGDYDFSANLKLFLHAA